MSMAGIRAQARGAIPARHHPVAFPELFDVQPSGLEGFRIPMGEERPADPRMAEFERLMRRIREPLPVQEEAPRAYTPMEAPDTGEIDATAIPASYFARNRAVESGNRPDAVNPASGAGGLYQFLESTWHGLMKERPDLGLTPEGRTGTSREAQAEQDRAMRYFTAQNARTLQSAGIQPTAGRLYALHFAGPDRGVALIKGADEDLSRIFPQSYFKANPFLKSYRTGRDLMAEFDRRFS
ncbi:MAG: hypothetical protein ACOY4R_27845 [Pseudomonadota bacterium]